MAHTSEGQRKSSVFLSNVKMSAYFIVVGNVNLQNVAQVRFTCAVIRRRDFRAIWHTLRFWMEEVSLREQDTEQIGSPPVLVQSLSTPTTDDQIGAVFVGTAIWWQFRPVDPQHPIPGGWHCIDGAGPISFRR